MIYWYCKDTSAYLPEIGQIRHFFKERNGNLTRRTVQEEQARLRKQRKKAQGFLSIFKKPLHESLTSVLPIMLIVLALGFTIAPVPNNAMMAFLLGGVLLIVGMGLFTLGSEMSMIPLGQAVGSDHAVQECLDYRGHQLPHRHHYHRGRAGPAGAGQPGTGH